MSQAIYNFHQGLDFFLSREARGEPLQVAFKGRQSVKHLIEALGVPHTEVGRIQVNGQQSDLGYITQDGDQVEVWPNLPGCPFDPPRFLLDSHLGRLAAHLRMLGFDCLYRNDYDDEQLAHFAAGDNRILLSRDRHLLMRKILRFGYSPRSLDPLEQLREVVRRYDLAERIQPFRRCIRCNGLLEPVDKRDVLARLEPLTRKYFNDFAICQDCDQVYWQGSHYERMLRLIRTITVNGEA